MGNKSKRVVGSYNSVPSVRKALEALENEGHAREDISVYANEPTGSQTDTDSGKDIPNNQELQNRNESKDDDSFWEEVKDIFTPNRSEDAETENPGSVEDRDLLAPYQDDMTNGHIILALRGDSTKGPQL